MLFVLYPSFCYCPDAVFGFLIDCSFADDEAYFYFQLSFKNGQLLLGLEAGYLIVLGWLTSFSIRKCLLFCRISEEDSKFKLFLFAVFMFVWGLFHVWSSAYFSVTRMFHVWTVTVFDEPHLLINRKLFFVRAPCDSARIAAFTVIVTNLHIQWFVVHHRRSF